MASSPTPTESGHTVLNATRARSGIRGTHLIWVLVISTFLAAAGLFIAWTARAPQLAATNSDNGGPGSKAGKAYVTPPSAPVVPQPAPTTP